ncbi:hypothetical protein ACH44C_01190 [Streptomyces purpureus]|uniref:hypothetical protein n=1 Tax=Streptomyces purpureus TaxID=1951 RepID=UPI00036E8A6E|nr:hypothetical protein [Streptomyces purpureus]
MRTIARLAVLTLVVGVPLTGCAVPQDRLEAVRKATERFATLHTAGDFRAACALLTPAAREEAVHNGGPTCAQALADAELPEPGAIRSTDVYGRQARVELATDTYFLTSFPGGWRISAAGCTPREGRPYRCLLKGD